jgi:hypothetical protein
MFITSFTTDCHLSLSWTGTIKSNHTAYFLMVYYNIILSTRGSAKWFPDFGFLTKTLYACYISHTRYTPHPSHSYRFYHPNNTGLAVQTIKFLIMKFSPLPCHLVPLRPKYSPQHLIIKHSQSTFLPQCERPSFTPTKATGKIIVLYIFICIFLNSKMHGNMHSYITVLPTQTVDCNTSGSVINNCGHPCCSGIHAHWAT